LRTPALLASIRRMAASVLDNVGARLELLGIEWAEERSRLVWIAVLAAIVIGGALLALGFVGVAALAWAWNTPDRLLVAALIPLAFILVAGGAALAMRRLAGQASGLFRQSVQELRRDIDALRRVP
jgi:uncharacterized membrane protein YqjE